MDREQPPGRQAVDWLAQASREGPSFVRVVLRDLSDGMGPVYDRVGGWFRSPGVRSWAPGEPFVPSPRHGRSACIALGPVEHVAVKGVGWTWAQPRVFRSEKDPQLTFGLLARADAERELRVSRELARMGVPAGRVLGHGLLGSVPGPDGSVDLSGATWSDGTPIQPCLCYTRHTSAFRVADLGLLDPAIGTQAAGTAAAARGWPPEQHVERLAADLGRTLATLHRMGCVNDTLAPDNLTLAGEITDFEWFTVPGIPLPDGSDTERLAERQDKELTYAMEVVCHLAWGLRRPAEAAPGLTLLLDSYRANAGPRGATASALRDADVALVPHAGNHAQAE